MRLDGLRNDEHQVPALPRGELTTLTQWRKQTLLWKQALMYETSRAQGNDDQAVSSWSAVSGLSQAPDNAVTTLDREPDSCSPISGFQPEMKAVGPKQYDDRPASMFIHCHRRRQQLHYSSPTIPTARSRSRSRSRTRPSKRGIRLIYAAAINTKLFSFILLKQVNVISESIRSLRLELIVVFDKCGTVVKPS